jgi:hypothetical protein
MKPVALIMVLLLVPCLAAAISDGAALVNGSLESARADMRKMIDDGFSVTRYNDSLFTATRMFEGQLAVEEAGKEPDFSLVLGKLIEMEDMKNRAYRSLDELTALRVAINQTQEIDPAPAMELYEAAEQEFMAERYEQCLEVIDRAYDKISELEALQTKVLAFAEATSRSIVQFYTRWWIELTIIEAAAAVTILLTYRRIGILLLKRRIMSLGKRRDSIKGLVAKTQREYFGSGGLSEATYRIRTKKYGELIRDINRQIPVLRAELAIKEKRKI